MTKARLLLFLRALRDVLKGFARLNYSS